jgi:hypothetical protein
VRDKLRSAFTCLLVAILFGGIGAFAGWLAGTTVYDGWRARDWVKVRAQVAGQAYSYEFDRRHYTSGRLGLTRVGSDDVDGWTDAIADAMEEARLAERPITVYVNPDNPAEAVVDRRIHWKFVVGITPFIFGFGGVGAGALWGMVLALRAMVPGTRQHSAGYGKPGPLAVTWIAAFFWNAIAFPIAFMRLPEVAQAGEWLGFAVLLLFPLIGVLLLGGALHGSWKALRGRFRVKAPLGPPGRAA